jgi:hypothetical protein
MLFSWRSLAPAFQRAINAQGSKRPFNGLKCSGATLSGNWTTWGFFRPIILERMRVELKEMSPAQKEAWRKQYVNSLPRVLFNIFGPCLCLSVLAWLIPAIGKSYWTLHASEPGSAASALIWLTLVAIGLIWQLYGLFAAVPFILMSIRILREEYLNRPRNPK